MFGCTVKRNIVNTNVYKTKISVAATLLYPGNNETAKRRFPTTYAPKMPAMRVKGSSALFKIFRESRNASSEYRTHCGCWVVVARLTNAHSLPTMMSPTLSTPW
jgi:hypothetical protein